MQATCSLPSTDLNGRTRDICGLIRLKSRCQLDRLTVTVNVFRSDFTLSVRLIH